MAPDKCALIIPSSVHVSARYTALLDPGQRAAQYMGSLTWYIRESLLTKIIVCDNSGYHYPESLHELAAAHNKEIELLNFAGNHELIVQRGKGYGEGEIMEFIMTHSLLLKKADGFLKVTGRLKLVNIDKVLGRCKADENYFNPISLLRPKFLVPKAARTCVEVRAYYVTKVFFTEVLLGAYKEVSDDQIFFLEHAYYQAIVRSLQYPAKGSPASPIHKVKCFPVAPEITGVSGSNGWTFRERSWPKKVLIKVAARLGYIRPVAHPTSI